SGAQLREARIAWRRATSCATCRLDGRLRWYDAECYARTGALHRMSCAAGPRRTVALAAGPVEVWATSTLTGLCLLRDGAFQLRTSLRERPRSHARPDP